MELPWQHALTHVMTMSLMAVLAGLALRPARTDPVTGDLILSFSWVLRILYWSGFALFAGLAVGPMIVLPAGAKPPGQLFVFLFSGSFAVPFGICAWLVTWNRIQLDETGITRYSACRLPRTIAWEDIEVITHSSSSGWFTVRDRQGGNIRVSEMLTGVLNFRTQVRRRLPFTVYAQAWSGFDKLGSPPNL